MKLKKMKMSFLIFFIYKGYNLSFQKLKIFKTSILSDYEYIIFGLTYDWHLLYVYKNEAVLAKSDRL